MFHTGRSDVATQEIATNTAKTDSVKAKIIAAGELYDRSRKIGATEPTPPRACLVAEDRPRSVIFRWKAVVAVAGAVERKLTDIKLKLVIGGHPEKTMRSRDIPAFKPRDAGLMDPMGGHKHIAPEGRALAALLDNHCARVTAQAASQRSEHQAVLRLTRCPFSEAAQSVAPPAPYRPRIPLVVQTGLAKQMVIFEKGSLRDRLLKMHFFNRPIASTDPEAKSACEQ